MQAADAVRDRQHLGVRAGHRLSQLPQRVRHAALRRRRWQRIQPHDPPPVRVRMSRRMLSQVQSEMLCNVCCVPVHALFCAGMRSHGPSLVRAVGPTAHISAYKSEEGCWPWVLRRVRHDSTPCVP